MRLCLAVSLLLTLFAGKGLSQSVSCGPTLVCNAEERCVVTVLSTLTTSSYTTVVTTVYYAPESTPTYYCSETPTGLPGGGVGPGHCQKCGDLCC